MSAIAFAKRMLCATRRHGSRCFVLVMTLQLASNASADEPPACLLIYSGDSQLVVGKNERLPTPSGMDEVKVFMDNCDGVQIRRGSAVAVVEGPKGRFRRLSFEAVSTITKDKLAESQPGLVSTTLRKLFDPVFVMLSSGDDKHFGGVRGGGEIASRFLVDAFSGTIVFSQGELRIPLTTGPLRSITTFTLQTGDALRRPVRGVALINHVVVIDPEALAPGESFHWTATVKDENGTAQYDGEFSVADAAEQQSVESLLQSRIGSANGGNRQYLLDAAALYLSQGLKANATIAMAQWYGTRQLSP